MEKSLVCGLSSFSRAALTDSKLPPLTTPQANESEKRGAEARNMTLFGKPAD